VISVYDIRHKIIPNKLVWIFIILSLISGFLVNCQLLNVNCFIGNWKLEIGNLGSHILSGVVLSLPLALIWLLSKGKLMGLGDAKLALGIGFLLGLSQGVAALVLSFWIGAIFGIILIIFSRFIRAAPVRSLWRRRAYLRSYPRFSASMKSEIPFGPFLIISTFIIFLFDLDVISLLSLFVT
jgi:leader peptidase (prepilin peptidase)/N-methyltransferase